LALSFSTTFADDEKVNATTSMNATTNITMPQNMTSVTNETMNMTKATNPFAEVKKVTGLWAGPHYHMKGGISHMGAGISIPMA
jgi:hypothetical protein